ncbi:hypothetical protein [Nocardia sp. BMG111209]|uniref:hypothetical protein n=1 Tax=Nocardia sp. BMG111209 TaxID=1160137 RepID=UPI00036A8168|nr:hypothetical protein [Nocardia sp. BMG111209]
MNDLTEVRRFEAELDAALEARPLIAQGTASSIVDCVAVVTMAFSRPHAEALGGALANGLQIALGALMRRGATTASPPSVDDLVRDLLFLGHYYILRELLYYTYNMPDSLQWSFTGERVTIAFRDPSLRREFALRYNTAIVTRIEFHSETERMTEELHSLLVGAPEIGQGEHIDRAFELCTAEAEHRMRSHFDMLGGESSNIEFPDYSYADLYRVYRYLLTKAIYHRHYAEINDLVPMFRFDRDSLLLEIEYATGIAQPTIAMILDDMTYSVRTAAMQPMHFSLVEPPDSGEYLMIADRIIDNDGIAKVLRVHALRAPGRFNATLSEALGKAFNKTVAADFEAAGFHVRTNIELDKFSPGAPDIDILAISPEATLGYFVFLCETKGFLPGFWAKDYLRAADKAVIPKAYEQLERIDAALCTDAGREFFVDVVTHSAPQLVEQGLITGRHIIVTSQNSGMFFDQRSRDVPVIDYRTLRLLLRRCDGDVLYILHYLTQLPELFGADDPVTMQLDIGGRVVEYEGQGFSVESVVNYESNTWKTDGLDEAVAEEFFAAGGSPFDVLDECQVTAETDPTSPSAPQ